MIKVGLTGGIGSGKSTVAEVFRVLGIPVLNADAIARWLMEHDPELVAGVKALFGEQAYDAAGRLQRAWVAAQVFGNPERLAALNALSHPSVWRHGAEWFAAQVGPYAVKEAALFYESGSAAQVDFMIGVQAPDELRIARVLAREEVTPEEVRLRMARQLPQKEKLTRCDAVILNDDATAVLPQVLALHARLSAGTL